MLEDKIRPQFQAIFVTPVAQIFSKFCHPNQITAIALSIGIFSAITLVFDLRTIAILLLLLSGYLDILDGAIARINKQSSPFGTMMDILSDRFVESAIIIALVYRQSELAFVGLFMLSAMLLCVSSFLIAGIFSSEASHKSFHYSSGLMERAEAFIFFIIMILLPSLAFYLGVIFTVLVLWTAIVRLYKFYKMINKAL
jgi:archaetidylinositol phosphate synthase